MDGRRQTPMATVRAIGQLNSIISFSLYIRWKRWKEVFRPCSRQRRKLLRSLRKPKRKSKSTILVKLYLGLKRSKRPRLLPSRRSTKSVMAERKSTTKRSSK